MYFNQQMFNPDTVNPQYYQCIRNQIMSYEANQDLEVAKAVKAIHDLCEAVKEIPITSLPNIRIGRTENPTAAASMPPASGRFRRIWTSWARWQRRR